MENRLNNSLENGRMAAIRTSPKQCLRRSGAQVRNLFAAIGMALLLGGCATSPPVRYYSLAMPDVAALEPGEGVPIVSIGPLDFPAYLSRLQMVTRAENAELRVDDYHRWAAPLDDEFGRVVAAHVENRLGRAAVVAFPYSGVGRPEFRVYGSVSRFEVDAAGEAVLIIQWSIMDSDDTLVSSPQRSRYTSVASSPGSVDARVAAMDATLAQLSDDIVDRLNAVLK